MSRDGVKRLRPKLNIYGLSFTDTSFREYVKVRKNEWRFCYYKMNDIRQCEDDEIRACYNFGKPRGRVFYKEGRTDFLNFYEHRVKQNKAHFHECVGMGNKVGFFMDCDYKYAIISKYKVCVRVLLNFLDVVKSSCKFPVKVMYLDSSNKKKFSKHVRSKSIWFKNTQCLALFVAKCFTKYLKSTNYSIWEKEVLYRMIDFGVYRKNGTIRMYYSSKVEDKEQRKLLYSCTCTNCPSIVNKKKQVFDRDHFKLSSITNWFPKESNFVDVGDVVQGYKDTNEYKELDELLIKLKFKPAQTKSEFTNSDGLTISRYRVRIEETTKEKVGIDNPIIRLLNEVACEYTDNKLNNCFQVQIMTKDNVLEFVSCRLMGKYCPLKGGNHKSHGRTMLLNIGSGKMFIRCPFNDKCNHEKKNVKYILKKKYLDELK